MDLLNGGSINRPMSVVLPEPLRPGRPIFGGAVGSQQFARIREADDRIPVVGPADLAIVLGNWGPCL